MYDVCKHARLPMKEYANHIENPFLHARVNLLHVDHVLHMLLNRYHHPDWHWNEVFESVLPKRMYTRKGKFPYEYECENNNVQHTNNSNNNNNNNNVNNNNGVHTLNDTNNKNHNKNSVVINSSITSDDTHQKLIKGKIVKVTQ